MRQVESRTLESKNNLFYALRHISKIPTSNKVVFVFKVTNKLILFSTLPTPFLWKTLVWQQNEESIQVWTLLVFYTVMSLLNKPILSWFYYDIFNCILWQGHRNACYICYLQIHICCSWHWLYNDNLCRGEKVLYSTSPGTDVRTQAQLVSACTHSLFLCAISLGAGDLEQRFANKRAISLPGDGETEYTSKSSRIWYMLFTISMNTMK